MSDDLDLVAASYVLGLSRGDARAAQEAEIASNPALRARVELWERNFVALDLAAEGMRPNVDLFTEILAAVDAAEPVVPGTATRRAGAEAWTEMAPGVTYQILFDDPISKRRSLLIRAQPGAVLDAHHHPNGHEECLLLEGDLSFGDLILHAGDFHIAYAHSVHPVATTRTGCLLHVSTAL